MMVDSWLLSGKVIGLWIKKSCALISVKKNKANKTNGVSSFFIIIKGLIFLEEVKYKKLIQKHMTGD